MELAVHNERRKRDMVECELFGNERVELLTDFGRRIGLLELADMGTLIIKNIENMFPHIQEQILKFLETGIFFRVGGDGPIHSKVRIIATTKDIELAQKQLDPKLFNILSDHRLKMPSLREHKKDIPKLIEHFMEKICESENTHMKKFSDGAINKLLKYNYPGNVRELVNVVERAIVLSRDNESIEDEEIFLGEKDIESKNRFNLLNIPFIKRFCNGQKPYSTFKAAIMVFFIATIYLLIAQPDILIKGTNIVLILCWKLWLPFLFVAFLFTSRMSCGLCPMFTISKFIHKYVGLKIRIPEFIKKYDIWIMGIGFVFIIFIEEYTNMALSTTKTAYLILGVLFGAIIFDFIFEKYAWCRHLCPLGGMSGLFGMSSMTEVRANKNVCTTICATHDCYKGSEKTERCPMFLHLQFLSDNRECKFCFNCIKNCKFNAIQLNLRVPGAEIRSLNCPPLAGAIFSIILCGLLFAEILSKQYGNQSHIPIIFLISILSVLTVSLTCNYFSALMTKDTVSEQLRYFGYTLLPLTLFGHVALKSMEIFEDVSGSLKLLSIFKFHYNSINMAQVFMITIGFFITEYLIYRIVEKKTSKEKQFTIFAVQGVPPLIFAIIYIMLFCSTSRFLSS